MKVLYVEDDPDIRAIATMSLEVVGGLQLCSCAGAEEAIARAPGFGPDLLLLDVMMPGRDGPATLAALRGLPGLDGVPAVFMTARAQAHEIERYRALGALGVITKPFEPMGLADQVRELWARAA